MKNLPDRVGKYLVLGQLGEGATSIVLQGHDPFAERMVAIKLFRGGTKQSGRLKGADRVAFLNEAKLVGRLNHPHIVALLDAAAESDHAYVIMEFVRNGTLSKYTSAERLLPVEKVVEIAFKISRALEYAHSRGVIHRDIKPSNVLVTDTLDVKVSDFGIAIVKDATHTHLLNAGTPAYVAPEQLSSEPSTQQGDIYSLGVLMYQLLTGRLPFSASSHASLMYQIVNHDPPTPRTLRRDLPEELEAILLRALQKDPVDRHANWAEFCAGLARFTEAFVAPRDLLSDARRFQALRALMFFRDFSDVEVWEALRIAHWRSISDRKTIIAEGESGDSFYVLVDGEVEVTRSGRHLAALRRGHCFGEMLYFSNEPTVRTTTIRARGPVLVAEIKANALMSASDRCQVQFNKAFMRILINRLGDANKRLAER